MGDDDPFACFGSDDDNDDDKGESSSDSDASETKRASAVVDRARRLAEEANARHAERGTATATATDSAAGRVGDDREAGDDEGGPDDEADHEEVRRMIAATALSPVWPDRPPLYLGPMIAVGIGATAVPTSSEQPPLTSSDGEQNIPPEYVGGGRGYVAARNLSPGTLLLVEEPIAPWPGGESGGAGGGAAPGLEAVESILGREDAQRILSEMEELHPTRRDVDEAAESATTAADGDAGETAEEEDHQIGSMLSHLQSKHGSEALLAQLLDRASETGIKRSDGRPLSDRDVYRTLLAMRYNGFESGIYLHFALFNHDDDPNCVKFLPESGPSSVDAGDDARRRKYSEVRTTRPVRRGEPLTLHYLNPREVCHADRRRRLWMQHRFDIGEAGDIGGATAREMELVEGQPPPSSNSDRSGSAAAAANDGEEETDDNEGGGAAAAAHPPTFYVERALTDLEDLLRSVSSGATALAARNPAADAGAVRQLFQRSGELELTSYELLESASHSLSNPRHVLLIRCLRLHLDAAAAVASIGASPSGSSLPGVDRSCLDALGRFVRTALRLLELQRFALGRDHPDVARTCHDCAEAIGTLLARSPKTLFELDAEGLGSNFGAWSREEDMCRRERARIDALYPRDVEERIAGAAAAKAKAEKAAME